MDSGGMFKDYDLPKVRVLSTRIDEMDALSLNHWLGKFAMELAKKSIERYLQRLCMTSTVCGILSYHEEKNGTERLNPLNNCDKK